MKFVTGRLVVLSLLGLSLVQCNTTPSYCPPCVNSCPSLECDCTDINGFLFTAPPATQPPNQTPRPEGCVDCPLFGCPVDSIICPPPTTQCTDFQLQSYVPVCPDCVDQAGCQQFGCDCVDCYGTLLTPPTNPPQPPRPGACPTCSTTCLKAPMLCRTPTANCTSQQLSTYVPKCPPCVPQAGCQQIGCYCIDCYGNIMIPAVNPPQPPRLSVCPPCNTVCDVSNVSCPAGPTQCTAEQIAQYDYKNSPCFVRGGKC